MAKKPKQNTKNTQEMLRKGEKRGKKREKEQDKYENPKMGDLETTISIITGTVLNAPNKSQMLSGLQ